MKNKLKSQEQNNWYYIFIFLYFSLLVSFYYGENSTGGAVLDYFNQKKVSQDFAENFKNSFYNYDNYSTRHSPILIIFLSLFEKLNVNDQIIRFIHMNLCLILPLIIYKTLSLNIKSQKAVLILTSLVFLSPTFRSLSIWPDSRILGLTFFIFSIYFFIKFLNEKKIEHCYSNILFLAIASYISPNFSVFSIFYFYHFLLIFRKDYFSIFTLFALNLILALPAFYYVVILDINFFYKTAAVGVTANENMYYKNFANNFLILSTMIFFYILPFIYLKIIKINLYEKFKSKILISLILFLICFVFFDYKYSYTGGGIFFKFSYFIFNNNYLFYSICIISLYIILSVFNFKFRNYFLFILLILNNPQITVYHKYFDPLLIIMFFTLFNFDKVIENFNKIKSYSIIYFYFLFFLFLNNIKTLWIIN